MPNELLDLIWYRINLKKAKYNARIKSITLGINIYDKVLNELNDVKFASTAVSFYNSFKVTPTFFGYPMSISYGRKNLIQINLDIKRPPRITRRYVVGENLQIIKSGNRGYSKYSYEMMKKSLDFSQNSGIVLCDDGFRQEG